MAVQLGISPLVGGFFERMIKSTKRCLKKSMKLYKLTYEAMTTIIAEIEAVLNSRPLTYIQTDKTDVLTPFHLYTGTRSLDPPDPRLKNFMEMKPGEARQRVQKIDKIIGSFWNTWSKDYLTSLRENAINLGRKGVGPQIGDIVVIHEDNKKRMHWKLGRVVDLIKGKDGVIRGAKVKTDSTYSGGVIERPLQKLFPLEMGRGEADGGGSNDNVAEAVASAEDVPDPPESSSPCPRYPLRNKTL